MGNIFEGSKVVFNNTKIRLSPEEKSVPGKESGFSDNDLKKEMENSVEALENAKKDAVKICVEAQKEGFDKGFEEGYEEGRKSAEADQKKIYSKMLHEAKGIIEDVSKEKKRCIESLKNDTLDIALVLAKKILDYEIEVNEAVLIGIFEKVLHEYSSEGKVKVYVNPRNKRIIDERLKELDKEGANLSDIEISEARGMDNGDIIFETEKGNINAGIDSQYEQLKSVLMSKAGKNRIE